MLFGPLEMDGGEWAASIMDCLGLLPEHFPNPRIFMTQYPRGKSAEVILADQFQLFGKRAGVLDEQPFEDTVWPRPVRVVHAHRGHPLRRDLLAVEQVLHFAVRDFVARRMRALLVAVRGVPVIRIGGNAE